MSHNGEPPADRLGVEREATQPTTHRRGRHAHHLRRPAITDPERLGHQRGADHLGQVTAANKRVHPDHHVRHPTTATTGPARPAPLLTAGPTHHPPPRPTPRPQPAAASRTRELSRHQSAFDFRVVSSYDGQRCLRASRRALPSRPSEKREGPARSGHLHACLRTRRRATRRLPHAHVSILDVATTSARPQATRRSTRVGFQVGPASPRGHGCRRLGHLAATAVLRLMRVGAL